MVDFTTEDVQNELNSKQQATLKKCKASGTNGGLPEFLKNLGPRSIKLNGTIFTHIANTNNIVNPWHYSKVITIVKPNKEPTYPKSYKTIYLTAFVNVKTL